MSHTHLTPQQLGWRVIMLTGRINWRYGAVVILGCFILFAAVSIAAGIQSTASAIIR